MQDFRVGSMLSASSFGKSSLHYDSNHKEAAMPCPVRGRFEQLAQSV
jgi:hypothetical protein